MTALTLRSSLAGLVCLPAVAAVLWFAWKGLELALIDPAARRMMAANLSEAVALNDRAATFWLLETGADPNREYPVRAFMIMEYPVTLTPLQAAVFTREVNLYQRLTGHGARATADELRFLFCLALDVGAAELSEVISRSAGLTAEAAACQPEAAVDRIRTQRVELPG